MNHRLYIEIRDKCREMRKRIYDWESDGGMKSLTKRKWRERERERERE